MNKLAEINEIVNRETLAFDTKDVELFLSVIHPDMVWSWPPDARAHDPIDWVIPWGRYNKLRWDGYLHKFFDKYELIHNDRNVVRIKIAKEEDGAIVIVDVDSLWRTISGDELHWKGRACKTYTLLNNEWKMISQVGLLDYSTKI